MELKLIKVKKNDSQFKIFFSVAERYTYTLGGFQKI